ncbi:MAG: neutral/alkaline non-lysosomal ceramidase N-terminal domain-containing protein [Candidatus Fervidibacter sp.]|uniref:neutral/alkaline non-lysosomal ceramidase N-terminal domain-containing protein n=1 Tax=Candidatus Fervidibacter sp. TaxID=3100871 RepID=UPI00404A1238
MGWKAGFGEADITPPIGVWLTGFVGRTKPCDDIHDPITAKALVLENGRGERAAILGLDLIALTENQVYAIRKLISDWTGIKPQNLLINCSHTHSAPAVGGVNPSMGTPDPSYLDVMVRKAATAVKLACDNLKEAKLFFGKAECDIGINRRQKTINGRIVIGQNPEGFVDREVSVLAAKLDGTDFWLIAFSHPCHPVVRGYDNYSVTADFVHFARRSVEGFFGGNTFTVFLQGCCGNIAPRERGSFEIAEKLGRELATSVAQAVLKAEPIESETIGSAIGSLKLPLLPPPPAKQLKEHYKRFRKSAEEAKRDGRLVEAKWRLVEAEWAKRLLHALRENLLPSHLQMNAQVLRVGDVCFAALASEAFAEIGMNVKSQAPFVRAFTLGYTNGCIGYLPTAKAHEEGGYEVEQAFKFYGQLLMHAPESEKIATDWLLQQMHKLATI